MPSAHPIQTRRTAIKRELVLLALEVQSMPKITVGELNERVETVVSFIESQFPDEQGVYPVGGDHG